MVRKLGAVVWTALAIVYWTGNYTPSWWFVGFMLTVIAIDFILAAIEQHYERKVECWDDLETLDGEPIPNTKRNGG